MDTPVVTEVCVDSVAGVRIAVRAGADRVELCSGLDLGGLTPSAGLIEQAVAAVAGTATRVHVLIRPRGGDFVHTADEVATMRRDLELALASGAHGVVLGALRPDGTIDDEVLAELVPAASPGSITFHRAFDHTADPVAALERVRQWGIGRILTSGRAPSAAAGAELLAALVRQGADGASPVQILAAGGIGPDDVAALIRTTGVREVHFSARRLRPSAMVAVPGGVRMGPADTSDRAVTDAAVVAATISAARSA